MGHESKCAHIHGHNYVVELEAAGDLDAIGRVIDFSVIKAVVGQWIDEQWDHGMILHNQDLARHFISDYRPFQDTRTQKLYLMADNPTAENMAQLLCEKANELLAPHGVRIISVTLHETENCKATYRVPVKVTLDGRKLAEAIMPRPLQ